MRRRHALAEYDQDVCPIRICTEHGVYISGPVGSVHERMCPDCHSNMLDYLDFRARQEELMHGLKVRA